MSQKLPVNGLKWENDLSRFNERFIKNYNENSNIGYFLEEDAEYPEKIFGYLKDLQFLPERKKIEQVKKLCLWYRRQRKIRHGLILKRIQRVIQFN